MTPNEAFVSWKPPMTEINDGIRRFLSAAKHGSFDGWERITLPETPLEVRKIKDPADGMTYESVTETRSDEADTAPRKSPFGSPIREIKRNTRLEELLARRNKGDEK